MSIPKPPLGFTWPQIISGLATGFFVIVMLFLGTKFASHDELNAAVQPVANIPARVEVLERWQVEQKASQRLNEDKFGGIREDLAAMRAQMVEKSKNDEANFKRILDKLDER